MSALILVGGYGTRLRPLTLTTPKPLIHFCNKPILEHQIWNLSKYGIKEIVLAIAYKPTDITDYINELEKKYSVKIFYSIEEEPLGTGGPIKLAEKYLNKYDEFFVFNSDIICSFPLKDMINFHKNNNSQLTILVKEVEDPRKFGVVITEENKITKFEEKPKVPKSSLINAGIYILNKNILNLIPKKNISLEKEIFPKLANEGILHFFKLNKFWADIGNPLDFLKGQELYLNDLDEKKENEKNLHDCLCIYYDFKKYAKEVNSSNQSNLFITFQNIEELLNFIENESSSFHDTLLHIKIEGNVLISSKTVIKKNCILGNNVVLGDNVVIGEGCRVKNSCIMKNSVINSYSYIESSIIGSKTLLGNWSRVEGLCVLGEGVILKPEIFINNAFILPFKEIGTSIYDKGSIIM